MRKGIEHDRWAADIEMMTSVGVSEADAAWAREAVGGVLDDADIVVSRARVTLALLAGGAVAQPAMVSVQIEFRGHTLDTYAVAATVREAVRRAGDELRNSLEKESAGRAR